MHQEHSAAEPGANQDGNTDFRRAEQAPLCANSFRDDGRMWLYDEPYGPYVPRSIFRKKPEPAAPPPVQNPPAAPVAGNPEAEGETVESLLVKTRHFVDTIMAVLRPYTDAYQAVLECCRQHRTKVKAPLDLGPLSPPGVAPCPA